MNNTKSLLRWKCFWQAFNFGVYQPTHAQKQRLLISLPYSVNGMARNNWIKYYLCCLWHLLSLSLWHYHDIRCIMYILALKYLTCQRKWKWLTVAPIFDTVTSKYIWRTQVILYWSTAGVHDHFNTFCCLKCDTFCIL